MAPSLLTEPVHAARPGQMSSRSRQANILAMALSNGHLTVQKSLAVPATETRREGRFEVGRQQAQRPMLVKYSAQTVSVARGGESQCAPQR